MKRFFKFFFVFAGAIFLITLVFLFVGKYPVPGKVVWGVNFSQKHAENLGLDWQETYQALITEAGVKNIKLAVHWDKIESEEDRFNFTDLDWQIKIAEENNVSLLPVIGMKTPRWPECHLPDWAKKMDKSQQQARILKMLEAVVSRYNNSPAIKYWQVENEALFAFGECPWQDKKFFQKEVQLVKSLDSRPVVITDSGEWSFWFTPARLGDMVGITIYRQVWSEQLNSYRTYFLPPVFYGRKALLIKLLFGKKVICTELQAEPWGPKLLYDVPPEEQKKTMNLEQFRKNIAYAKRTGLNEFYLWGGEWWFWMKKEGYPEIWQEAKRLFM